MALLEASGIGKNFGETHVLKDISLDLEQGEALAIIGSSGSGKTTLLRCLNFLERPDTGVIKVNGETMWDATDPATQKESEIRKKRLHFGLVFQSFRHFMGLAPGEMEVVDKEYFPQGMIAEQAACFFPAFSRHLASLVGCIVHISLFLQFCDHLTHRRRGDLEGLRKFLICDNIMVFAEQIYCL